MNRYENRLLSELNYFEDFFRKNAAQDRSVLDAREEPNSGSDDKNTERIAFRRKSNIFFIGCLICTSCSGRSSIELPDINKKTFSYEEIVKKKNELKNKHDSVSKSRKME